MRAGMMGMTFLLLTLAAWPARGATLDDWRRKYPLDQEVSRGREVADEIDQKLGVVDDPARLEFVQGIVDRIAEVCDRPELEFDVKILDWSVENAFAISGGFVRVTRGLLDSIHSEHELAGVLAHEVAHLCCYHGLRQEEKDRQAGRLEMATNLVAILLAASGKVDPNFAAGAITANRFLRLQQTFGYSREFEMEADALGLQYLIKSGYNPAGYVTVMERFASQALGQWQGPDSLRDYDTHPPSADRLREIRTYLIEHRVPINRALVLRGHKAVAEEIEYEPGKRTWQIRFGETPVFQACPEEVDGKTPEERVTEIAGRMNRAIAISGLDTASVGLIERNGRVSLAFKSYPVLEFTPEDAAFLGLQPMPYARLVNEQLLRLLWHGDTASRPM